MKNLLQLILNLFVFIWATIGTIYCLIWYGKLPKVSYYHWWKHNIDVSIVFNDETFQSKLSPHPDNYKKGAEQFVSYLANNDKLIEMLNTDMPIRDEKGKEYGTTTVYQILSQELSNFNRK